MNELWNDLLKFWNGLDDRGRTGVVAGGAVILLLVGLLAFWSLRTDYQVLFADLEERDAAAIVDELKKRKITFQLEDNSTKILVPARHVHETRLALMSKGVLLNGGVGFEIFDNKDLGMTDYTQKINYQRALQGELVRTIMANEQVKLARVHLVVPEASIFKRDKSRSKASVSLVLKPGGRLSPEQIMGIQRLVSASVPGLETALVSVFDQRGVLLSALADTEDAAAGGSGKLRMKREAEDYLVRKIVEVMDRTFGPGKAIVSVDVSLNFDEIKRTQQDVLPARGEESGVIVRKRAVINRQGGPITKVADTDNVVSATAGQNSTTDVEYEFGRRIEEVVTAQGGVRRISVGVLVPLHLSEEQLKRVRSIVSMTAGLSEERGDAIAVHSVGQLLLGDTASSAGAQTTETQAGVRPLDSQLAGPETADQTVFGAPIKSRLVILGVLTMLIAVAAASLLLRRRRRQADPARLAETQRRKLLSNIEQWIAAEKSTASGAAKG
jgi:flagellar M-ring protein FliF